MPVTKQTVDAGAFNKEAVLPLSFRLQDFEIAMQNVYDFFFDVNTMLLAMGLHRMDDMLRPAAMSGMISDMLTASMAKHSRVLVENKFFNGHPDLVVQGRYPNNAIASGTDGIEVKSTRKAGGAVGGSNPPPRYQIQQNSPITAPAPYAQTIALNASSRARSKSSA